MEKKLFQLLHSRGDFVSGKELGAELGLNRAAIWRLAKSLQKHGHHIESAPRKGYRLASATGALSPVEMEYWATQDYPWAGDLYVLDSLGSTNDYAKELAAKGAPHGTVVVADRQEQGRGRMGRSFLSPQGRGIYFSMILRPNCTPAEIMHLTCCTAVAACDALKQAAGIRPGIKWTNDLVSSGRKLGGILTELSIEGESGLVQYAVVGIGINCWGKLADFDPSIRDMAGSLEMVTGKKPDRNRIIGALIRHLSTMSSTMDKDRLLWMNRYRASCITLGRAVSVSKAGQVQWGQALDVDDWGGLMVDFGQGTETVQAGEVSVRGIYGYV